MSGKTWTFTLFTKISFLIIYVHHVQSKCMDNDMQSHLYDQLLEDHFFEIKSFKDQHNDVSVINTLCSTWNKNQHKDTETFKAIDTFKMMLEHLFTENNTEVREMNPDELQRKCEKYNCAYGYEPKFINVTAFGSMYLKSCRTSLSSLECPSKKSSTSSTSTDSPTSTTSKWTTRSTTETSQNTTKHEYWKTTSSTTAFTQFSTSSTSTYSPATNAPKSDSSIQGKLVDTSIKVALPLSLILNVLLVVLTLYLWKRRKHQENTETEVRLIELQNSRMGANGFA